MSCLNCGSELEHVRLGENICVYHDGYRLQIGDYSRNPRVILLEPEVLRALVSFVSALPGDK